MNSLNTGALGSSLSVSALSLGCMGMSEFYGATDEQESIATIHRALDPGHHARHRGRAGPHTNEVLVGRALAGRREGVIVATKFDRPVGRPGLPGRQQPARACARELRGVAAPAGDRCDRPLLPASRRSQHPDRRYGRRDGRPRARRESAAHRPVRGGRRNVAPRVACPPDRRASK